MNFEQASTLLANVMSQMQGVEVATPLDERAFISMGNTALKTGYDPLMTAISQVISRTIFSIRDYDTVFEGIIKNEDSWGAIVRKLTPLDQGFIDDVGYNLTDGDSIDMYTINKQKAIELRFYGSNLVEKMTTVTLEQLRTAFSNSQEFGSFMAMQMTNIYNEIKQSREARARLTMLNMIGAKFKADKKNVIHLLTEYKNETGNTTITKSNVFSKEEFVPFAQWLYGYIGTLSDYMKERSSKYHFNIKTYNGAEVKPIMRFTRNQDRQIYMLNKMLKHLNATVLASVYNEKKLSLGDIKSVNFWQTLDAPEHIEVIPNYLKDDGTVEEGDTVPVVSDDVIGVISDVDALGVVIQNESELTTPLNARGRYYNVWWNWRERWFNDLSENFIVLSLSESDEVVEAKKSSKAGK